MRIWHSLLLLAYLTNANPTQTNADSNSAKLIPKQICFTPDDCPTSPESKMRTCINGECGFVETTLKILPVFQSISPIALRVGPAECTEDDTSRCNHIVTCTECSFGLTPMCSHVICEQSKCQIVYPCSINTTTEIDDAFTLISILNTCQENTDCTMDVACVEQCEPGFGPLCSTSECIEGTCEQTEPCSIKMERDGNNAGLTKPAPDTCEHNSDCNQPMSCVAQCEPGFGPLCSTSECIEGTCEQTEPCSVRTQPEENGSELARPTMNICHDDSACKVKISCVEECTAGLGPLCTQAKCVHGECVVTYPCTLRAQCNPTELGPCGIYPKCQTCAADFSPSCSTATCLNGQCKLVKACSIYTNPDEKKCNDDSACKVKISCVEECATGLGPLCTQAKCVDRKCVVTYPCTSRAQCTATDISRCPVPAICGACTLGRGPSCAQTSCDKGECKVIMPCSVVYTTTETVLTTATTTSEMMTGPLTCTTRGECRPRKRTCVVKCENGRTPRCASADCVNGRCVSIAPCSQQTCKVAAMCPANTNNCVRCRKGYGPACEQPSCKCGICSVVEPCSKKLTLVNIAQ